MDNEGELGLSRLSVPLLVGPLLRARLLSPYGVTITGGEQVTRDGRRVRVPKKDLVLAVGLLLEGRRLRIPPALPDARTLIEELHNFKTTVRLTGHESYGAGTEWREGAHDDMVLATAIAAWWGENRPQARVTTFNFDEPEERGGWRRMS